MFGFSGLGIRDEGRFRGPIRASDIEASLLRSKKLYGTVLYKGP